MLLAGLFPLASCSLAVAGVINATTAGLVIVLLTGIALALLGLARFWCAWVAYVRLLRAWWAATTRMLSGTAADNPAQPQKRPKVGDLVLIAKDGDEDNGKRHENEVDFEADDKFSIIGRSNVIYKAAELIVLAPPPDEDDESDDWGLVMVTGMIGRQPE
eukprot:g445.t1